MRHIFSDFQTLCCFSQRVDSTLNQIEQRVKKDSKWWQCYWGYYVMITFVIVFIGLGILAGHFLNQHVTENRIKTNLDQSSARHLGTVFENDSKSLFFIAICASLPILADFGYFLLFLATLANFG